MNTRALSSLLWPLLFALFGAANGSGQVGSVAPPITVDLSRFQSGGAIQVETHNNSLNLTWRDGQNQDWSARFNLDSTQPLITEIRAGKTAVIERAWPVYSATTGKRRGGWDAFFDFPPSHPDGIRSFLGVFRPKRVQVESIGDRVELSFDGMTLGIFSGFIRYRFFPGSRLVEQAAVLSTNEPDTAYFYDAGLEMSADRDKTAGGNMASSIAYFDPLGAFRTVTPAYGSERHPLAVKYRAVGARTEGGSVAVLAPPHRYLFARDYTTNMGYVWYRSWRGQRALGIRQLPDDNSPFYPWMNAPPGTEQRMSLFFLLGSGPAEETLKAVTEYTHGDRFPSLPGYQTFAPHWHLAYTEQAMEHGMSWEPPFVPVMNRVGIDSAMIMDFHGDGHPTDLTETRLREIKAFYQACRAQSNSRLLLIPAEEANTILGGHWALVFPKPVYWFMDRKPEEKLKTVDAKYGAVWRVHTPEDMWTMISEERGYVYQTHPRTKGSTGYPDKIQNTFYFRDPRYLGTGWKAMPSDLSSPRLGERGFRVLDDLNNWGLHKRAIGEVDVFQLDGTHELYGHMNVNYVRLPRLPTFDNYGQLLDAVARGEYFVSTGEVLLPSVQIAVREMDDLRVEADVNWTFPLDIAELVWGDGRKIHRKIIPLSSTRQFGNQKFTWTAKAPGWKWARLAIWDSAGNGAFTNPVWKDFPRGSSTHTLLAPESN
ncbi:MAG: hypothetical protein ACJ74Y_01020 [Bryobacteraceae bacterium]